MKDHVYFVYLATNYPRKTVLYTGVTKSLIKRDGSHRLKKYPDSFSARYNVNRIVYFESFGDIHLAIDREKQIKGWTREKKLKLIESINPKWKDLVEEIK